jgi:phosphatidate cytidylyltransferase
MLVDYYLQILHYDRRVSLDVDLGPLHVHLDGRPVFLMWVTIAVLAVGGIAVIASRKRELIDKWASSHRDTVA